MVEMEGRGRVESGGKNEGPTTTEGKGRVEDRREEKKGKGRGRDLPYQCQTACYASVPLGWSAM